MERKKTRETTRTIARTTAELGHSGKQQEQEESTQQRNATSKNNTATQNARPTHTIQQRNIYSHPQSALIKGATYPIPAKCPDKGCHLFPNLYTSSPGGTPPTVEVKKPPLPLPQSLRSAGNLGYVFIETFEKFNFGLWVQK